MKKIMMLMMLAVLLMPFQVFADNTKGETIHVGVDGMVCDFCAQSLKKLFLEKEAVKNIDISLEKKLLTIDTKPGKTLDDKTINEVVDYAGYKVSKIHHMPVKDK